MSPLPGPIVRRAPLGAKGWITVVVLAALVGGGIGGVVGAALARNDQQTIVKQFFPNASVLAKPQDVQEVLAKVLPAVVSIDTQAGQAANGPFGTGVVSGAGTGMIITPTGEVLTNNHVVAGATTLTVTLYGQTKERTAHVVGTDPSNDVALVQIDGGVSGLPTVTLGNSDAARVGDSVIAIGNALALAGGPTVTTGIVSAKGRTLTAQDPVTSATENLTGLIQTDAAINPGNSGGPLVNANGDVIAMNTAVADNQSGGAGNAQAQNIGFALSINQVKPLIAQMGKGGTVQPSQAFLGVEAQTVTPQLRQTYNLTPTRGAVVGAVTGDPARSAGLQVGDVIVAVDGSQISSSDDLVATISNHKPGDKVTLTVDRGTQQIEVPVTLGTRPSNLP
jgi:S1-C subfamily serine protease